MNSSLGKRLDCLLSLSFPVLPLFSVTLFVGYSISKIVLRGNHIRTIPSRSFENITLENIDSYSRQRPIIDISFNPLHSLRGDELAGIKGKAVSLRCDNCSLLYFPLLDKEAANKTTALYLRNNDIIKIARGGLQNYNNLKILDLSGNKRIIMRRSSLMGIENSLQEFYLRDMELTRIPTKLLRDLKALKLISLSNNFIYDIWDYTFDGFQSQGIRIDLQFNDLRDITRHALVVSDPDSNFSIDAMYLGNNMLETLEFLDNPCNLALSNTSVVWVDKNQLWCDCATYEIMNYKVVRVQGVCDSPYPNNNTVVDWRPGYPEDQLYFLLEAAEKCDEDSHVGDKYVCQCSKWLPYSDDGIPPECPVNSAMNLLTDFFLTALHFMISISLHFAQFVCHR